jgi:hypothetical protein
MTPQGQKEEVRNRLAILLVTLGVVFFFLAPIISTSSGTILCVPQDVYVSPSFKIFGDYGVVYWPTTGWVDFPPIAFHNVACAQG